VGGDVQSRALVHLPDAFSPTSGRSRKVGEDLKPGRLASSTGNPRFFVRGALSNRTVSPRTEQQGKTMYATPTTPGVPKLGDIPVRYLEPARVRVGAGLYPPRFAVEATLQSKPTRGPKAWPPEHSSEALWTQRGVGMRATPMNSHVSGDGVEMAVGDPPHRCAPGGAHPPSRVCGPRGFGRDWSPPVQAPPVRRNRSEQSQGVNVP
jgi:hypothetical protein